MSTLDPSFALPSFCDLQYEQCTGSHLKTTPTLALSPEEVGRGPCVHI